MAKYTMMRQNISRTRQMARKVGIKIESPKPNLPLTEREQSDIM
jgi:hypothetical protein